MATIVCEMANKGQYVWDDVTILSGGSEIGPCTGETEEGQDGPSATTSESEEPLGA